MNQHQKASKQWFRVELVVRAEDEGRVFNALVKLCKEEELEIFVVSSDIGIIPEEEK